MYTYILLVMYLWTYVYKKQKGMSKMLKKNKSWINIKRFQFQSIIVWIEDYLVIETNGTKNPRCTH